MSLIQKLKGAGRVRVRLGTHKETGQPLYELRMYNSWLKCSVVQCDMISVILLAEKMSTASKDTDGSIKLKLYGNAIDVPAHCADAVKSRLTQTAETGMKVLEQSKVLRNKAKSVYLEEGVPEEVATKLLDRVAPDMEGTLREAWMKDMQASNPSVIPQGSTLQ